MSEPLSPEELGAIFQAIDNEPTRKLSNLRGANLTGTNLSGANLSGAKL